MRLAEIAPSVNYVLLTLQQALIDAFEEDLDIKLAPHSLDVELPTGTSLSVKTLADAGPHFIARLTLGDLADGDIEYKLMQLPSNDPLSGQYGVRLRAIDPACFTDDSTNKLFKTWDKALEYFAEQMRDVLDGMGALRSCADKS